MGIQPRNAMTAQGYLNSLQSLGTVNQNTGYNPQAARRNNFAETWGSGQRGAPNYNKYMDKSNRDNYAPNGAWRGYVNGVNSLEHRARFGLGGTGPDPRVLQDDARREAQRKEWNATRARYARPHSTMSPNARMLPGGINSNQTPGIYVPGEKSAPPSNLLGNTSKDVVTEISAPSTGMSSGNPLMNTMKPRQKPKFGTLGANRGMNGMGLGPNSVAKPGTYGTY